MRRIIAFVLVFFVALLVQQVDITAHIEPPLQGVINDVEDAYYPAYSGIERIEVYVGDRTPQVNIRGCRQHVELLLERNGVEKSGYTIVETWEDYLGSKISLEIKAKDPNHPALTVREDWFPWYDMIHQYRNRPEEHEYLDVMYWDSHQDKECPDDPTMSELSQAYYDYVLDVIVAICLAMAVNTAPSFWAFLRRKQLELEVGQLS